MRRDLLAYLLLCDATRGGERLCFGEELTNLLQKCGGCNRRHPYLGAFRKTSCTLKNNGSVLHCSAVGHFIPRKDIINTRLKSAKLIPTAAFRQKARGNFSWFFPGHRIIMPLVYSKAKG